MKRYRNISKKELLVQQQAAGIPEIESYENSEG